MNLEDSSVLLPLNRVLFTCYTIIIQYKIYKNAVQVGPCCDLAYRIYSLQSSVVSSEFRVYLSTSTQQGESMRETTSAETEKYTLLALNKWKICFFLWVEQPLWRSSKDVGPVMTLCHCICGFYHCDFESPWRWVDLLICTRNDGKLYFLWTRTRRGPTRTKCFINYLYIPWKSPFEDCQMILCTNNNKVFNWKPYLNVFNPAIQTSCSEVDHDNLGPWGSTLEVEQSKFINLLLNLKRPSTLDL